jgi:hypothetical protein
MPSAAYVDIHEAIIMTDSTEQPLNGDEYTWTEGEDKTSLAVLLQRLQKQYTDIYVGYWLKGRSTEARVFSEVVADFKRLEQKIKEAKSKKPS